MAPVPDIRPLTPDERRLLEWLLHHGTPDALAYLPQLTTASVISSCGCGCPTIDLEVGSQAVPPGGSEILADFVGLSPEGVRVGVIVHARGGMLAELEVYSVIGDVGEFSLPDPDALA